MSPDEATGYAVECLTLWLETGPDARRRAAEHISELTSSVASPHDLIAGLLNLNMFTIGRLAQARGATTAAEIAAEQQSALSELALWLGKGGPTPPQ